jgi:hypothetical protein
MRRSPSRRLLRRRLPQHRRQKPPLQQQPRLRQMQSPRPWSEPSIFRPRQAPSLFEVGQTVKEGQTLLIIEAMKTMNQIPSPRAGTITEILVNDSEPVEFGQPLVVIA